MPDKRICGVCSHTVPSGHAYCVVCGHCLLETDEHAKKPDSYWIGAGISIVAVCCAAALFYLAR